MGIFKLGRERPWSTDGDKWMARQNISAQFFLVELLPKISPAKPITILPDHITPKICPPSSIEILAITMYGIPYCNLIHSALFPDLSQMLNFRVILFHITALHVLHPHEEKPNA